MRGGPLPDRLGDIMKRLLVPFIAAAALLTSGCLSMRSYVDPALGEVPAAERIALANPQPVQLIFEFRTQGTANTRATRLLQEQISETVRTSGLFSSVSSDPVPNGALLSLVIDNIPQDGAAEAGFTTGLTFGLAGSTISDYYVGTARYAPGSGGGEIAAEERHTLHSLIGAGEGPANMVQAENTEVGVRTVIRQLSEHLLFELANQPGFAPAPPLTAESPAS